MRHHIIEEGAFWDADLASPDTLAALLLRLGNCRQADQIIEVKDTVIDWLRRCDGFRRCGLYSPRSRVGPSRWRMVRHLIGV
jgi:hypothetical protein